MTQVPPTVSEAHSPDADQLAADPIGPVAALDGKPITAQAWAAIYPAHEKPFWTRGEDAA